MKNVKESQLKKCIYLTEDEYKRILDEIYETDVKVNCASDGLWYESDVDIDNYCLMKDLRDYFGVKDVVSIHGDDCAYLGIWIAYNE